MDVHFPKGEGIRIVDSIEKAVVPNSVYAIAKNNERAIIVVVDRHGNRRVVDGDSLPSNLITSIESGNISVSQEGGVVTLTANYPAMPDIPIKSIKTADGSGMTFEPVEGEPGKWILDIERPKVQGTVRSFYVDPTQQYTEGTIPDGTIIRPYLSFEEAFKKATGYNPDDNSNENKRKLMRPDFPYSRIVVVKSATTSINPTANNIIIDLQNNSGLTYTGTDEYMFDTDILFKISEKLDGLNITKELIGIRIVGNGYVYRSTPGGLLRVKGNTSYNSFDESILFEKGIAHIIAEVGENESDHVRFVEYSNHDISLKTGETRDYNGDIISIKYNRPDAYWYSTKILPGVPILDISGISTLGGGSTLYIVGNVSIETVVSTVLKTEKALIYSSNNTMFTIYQITTGVGVKENQKTNGILYLNSDPVFNNNDSYVRLNTILSNQGSDYFIPFRELFVKHSGNREVFAQTNIVSNRSVLYDYFIDTDSGKAWLNTHQDKKSSINAFVKPFKNGGSKTIFMKNTEANFQGMQPYPEEDKNITLETEATWSTFNGNAINSAVKGFKKTFPVDGEQLQYQ